MDLIRDPAERQIAVECLVAIHNISQGSGTYVMKPTRIDIMRVVKDAVDAFWERYCLANNLEPPKKTERGPEPDINELDDTVLATAKPACLFYNVTEKIARKMFFDLPQEGPDGTMSYLTQACLGSIFTSA
jgi:hypothetical protein